MIRVNPRLLLVLMSLGIIGFVVASPIPQESTAPQADDEKPLPEKVSFKNDVQPFLVKNCVKCHNNKRAKDGVNLEDKTKLAKTKVDEADLVVAGKPDKSALVWVLEGTHDVAQMPPVGKIGKRPITLIKKWITQGAKTDN